MPDIHVNVFEPDTAGTEVYIVEENGNKIGPFKTYGWATRIDDPVPDPRRCPDSMTVIAVGPGNTALEQQMGAALLASTPKTGSSCGFSTDVVVLLYGQDGLRSSETYGYAMVSKCRKGDAGHTIALEILISDTSFLEIADEHLQGLAQKRIADCFGASCG